MFPYQILDKRTLTVMALETHVTQTQMGMGGVMIETTAQQLPTEVRRTWMETGLGMLVIIVQRRGTKTKQTRTGMVSEMLAVRMPTVTGCSTSRIIVLR